MLHRLSREGSPNEPNCALQNCQYLARCGSRREHIRHREILAGWRSAELCASPRGSPCLIRPSGSRARGLLFIVCRVCGISCLAFGYAGKNNASSHRCSGMGSFRVSTPRCLREFQRTFRTCTDSFCCTCNLHWLGSLADKTRTLRVSHQLMNESGPPVNDHPFTAVPFVLFSSRRFAKYFLLRAQNHCRVRPRRIPICTEGGHPTPPGGPIHRFFAFRRGL